MIIPVYLPMYALQMGEPKRKATWSDSDDIDSEDLEDSKSDSSFSSDDDEVDY